MKPYDESQHPRGGRGRFVHKPHNEAEGSLDSDRRWYHRSEPRLLTKEALDQVAYTVASETGGDPRELGTRLASLNGRSFFEDELPHDEFVFSEPESPNRIPVAVSLLESYLDSVNEDIDPNLVEQVRQARRNIDSKLPKALRGKWVDSNPRTI